MPEPKSHSDPTPSARTTGHGSSSSAPALALLAMPRTWKACQTCSPASWPRVPSAPLSCPPWGWEAFPLPFLSLGLCCFPRERCRELVTPGWERCVGGGVPIFPPGSGMVPGRQGNCRRASLQEQQVTSSCYLVPHIGQTPSPCVLNGTPWCWNMPLKREAWFCKGLPIGHPYPIYPAGPNGCGNRDGGVE